MPKERELKKSSESGPVRKGLISIDYAQYCVIAHALVALQAPEAMAAFDEINRQLARQFRDHSGGW